MVWSYFYLRSRFLIILFFYIQSSKRNICKLILFSRICYIWNNHNDDDMMYGFYGIAPRLGLSITER